MNEKLEYATRLIPSSSELVLVVVILKSSILFFNILTKELVVIQVLVLP